MRYRPGPMAVGGFFDPEAKNAVAQAVRDVEAQTSAELVVAVRALSGHYRHADFGAGLTLGMIALLVLLFAPQSFAVATMPIDVALAFALGAFLCSRSHAFRRVFSSRKQRETMTRTAAHAAFYELGVSRTSGRNGVLVFVSMLERRAEVVPDIGIDPVALGEPWRKATEAVAASMSPVPDFARFVTALRALGPALGEVMPRAADDVNELPDEMSSE